MTALAGLWSFDGRQTGRPCSEMLGAQSCYGGDPAIISSHQISVGRRLFPTLPEDRFDRGPERCGELLLVADVRLDNRDELGARLGLEKAALREMSDARLLLAVLRELGDSAIETLVGEFAFALWSESERSLLLARDFVGTRPLYYHVGKDFAAFASMPSGLHALREVPCELDYEFMAEHLSLIPHQGSRCYFRSISRVPPGHLVRITPRGIAQSRFWRPPEQRSDVAEDAEEVIREAVDGAVKSQLRGLSADVATHLSSGLDSSIVTATAARVNSAHSVVAFTAAPRRDFGGPCPADMRPDERDLAALVARRYANVEHVIVETDATPLSGMAEECQHAQEPPVNLCNGVWLHAIYKAARDRGLNTLLMGSAGNITISYSGADLLPNLLVRGKLTELWGLGRQLARNGLPPRSLLAHTVGAFMPAPIWRAVSRMRGRATDLRSYSAVHPGMLPSVRRRARERGHDFLFRPQTDPFQARLWMLSRFDGGNNVKSVLARWGLSVRDPTADKRVVDCCFSLPPAAFVKGGVYRSLARRAFADRLPREILWNMVRGYQAADWYEGLAKDLPKIRELADALEGTEAARALDLDWIRSALDRWPESGWERDDVAMRYRAGLLRAVAAGHFMHSVQSR